MAESKTERSSLKRWPKKPDGTYGSSEPKSKTHEPKTAPAKTELEDIAGDDLLDAAPKAEPATETSRTPPARKKASARKR